MFNKNVVGRAAAAGLAVCMSFGALTVVSSPALADGHAAKAAKQAIQARRGYFQMLAMNLGPLGAMAKGEKDYDAAAAGTLSSNLALLANVDAAFLFPKGSDNVAMKGETRALPKIWEDMAGVGERSKALSIAAQAIADAAPKGLDELRGAIGAVGAACGECHKGYRAKEF